MSATTADALISYGGWNAPSRKNIAMAFLEAYTTTFFDKRDYTTEKINEWSSPDYYFQGSDGERHHGRDAAWTKIKELFGAFKAQQHAPHFAITVPITGENDELAKKDGKKRWLIAGFANAHFNLVDGPEGHANGKTEKVKGPDGREWDVVLHSAYRFLIVEDEKAKHGGCLLEGTEIYADPSKVFHLMQERHMVV